MGKLLNIYLRSARQEPVKEVNEVLAVIGTGLEGDHAKKGKRQVTVLAKKAWEQTCKHLQKEIDPKLRRANLFIEGIYFDHYCVGRILRVGKIRLRIAGETKPCRLMDESEAGLKEALTPDHRGGVFCEVVKGGVIKKGDTVAYGDNWCKWGFHDWIELDDFNQGGSYCPKCNGIYSSLLLRGLVWTARQGARVIDRIRSI